MLKHLGKVRSKLYSTIPMRHLMLGSARILVVFTVAIVRQENWRRIHNIPISETVSHQRLSYCCKKNRATSQYFSVCVHWNTRCGTTGLDAWALLQTFGLRHNSHCYKSRSTPLNFPKENKSKRTSSECTYNRFYNILSCSRGIAHIYIRFSQNSSSKYT